MGAGTHACWLGTYEREKLSYVCRVVRRGMALDVGAHAEFYTLALAGRCERVIAVSERELHAIPPR